MADVKATLRRTLQQLRAERTRLERQIIAIEGALTTLRGRVLASPAVPQRYLFIRTDDELVAIGAAN